MEDKDIVLHNKPGPIDADPKLAIKRRFLDAMARTNIITASAENSGASKVAIHKWINDGYISKEELAVAYEQYQDYIRGELTKRAFVGTSKPLIANGRLVYDREGKQVQITVVDSRLLMEMAKRHLPEYKEDAKTIIVQNSDGIPDEYRVVFDARNLTHEEWGVIKAIAMAVEDRLHGVVESGS